MALNRLVLNFPRLSKFSLINSFSIVFPNVNPLSANHPPYKVLTPVSINPSLGRIEKHIESWNVDSVLKKYPLEKVSFFVKHSKTYKNFHKINFKN